MKAFNTIGYALLLALTTLTAWAENVHVAVAANFTRPMQVIASEFEKTTSHKLLISYGSSGKLLEQIRNGAPFEVFLSADQNKPDKLEHDQLAIPGHRFTYAIGKLVLWSSQSDLVDAQGAILKTEDRFNHLAMANPKTAPYGKAAKETMIKLGVMETIQVKIVQGESIAQTREFVSSGNAQLGFVALSQIIQKGKISEGSYWMVPSELYKPIKQDAILLKTSQKNGQETAYNTPAKVFMDYLQSDEAKKIIKSFGYDLPLSNLSLSSFPLDVKRP